ncbi:hypothetical protein NIIDMKKI_31280 [Mycobacterium kansasii]|uniref:Uncharacterized protein n=1 Tax=Mycobacterium kansasii TaxID=1768 RepID=A0A7G1IDG5_MYCKA|nr:hypothetical protein NIIDMKKI_31280 [Mycobacterium kansasii]
MFGSAPGHQLGDVTGQRVELVDQQVEHIVSGFDDTGLDQPAPILTQQIAQHPNRSDHPVATDFPIP